MNVYMCFWNWPYAGPQPQDNEDLPSVSVQTPIPESANLGSHTLPQAQNLDSASGGPLTIDTIGNSSNIGFTDDVPHESQTDKSLNESQSSDVGKVESSSLKVQDNSQASDRTQDSTLQPKSSWSS